MPTAGDAKPDKPVDGEALQRELTEAFQATARTIVPWFVQQMPGSYFLDTDNATQLSHLRAIIAARASGRPLELTLRSEDGRRWTVMHPHNRPGLLAQAVAQLPRDPPLRAAKIHASGDDQLLIQTFEFGEGAPFDRDDPAQGAKLREAIAFAEAHEPSLTAREMTDYIHRCSAEYALTVSPLRIGRHLLLCRQIEGSDGTAVILEPETEPNESRIVVAVGNATTRHMLERLARRLGHAEININRAYLDVVDNAPHGTISLLGFVVSGPGGKSIDERGELWREVRRDLLRNKWLDLRTLDLAYKNPTLGTARAEVITGLCDLVHQVLVKRDPNAFSLERIHRLAARGLEQAYGIADLFLDRFNPDRTVPLSDQQERAEALRGEIDRLVDLEDARTVLHRLLDAVFAVLRCNVHREGRYCLAMRLEAGFLATPDRAETPYGVYFVHGRSLNGFHVRFRDIARGGMRVIWPRNDEQHAREAERLYDEAYNLAFAQQLKNKDIPEGGAKAAVLISPIAQLPRAAKAFVDGLLDLITPEPETQQRIVDYLGTPEWLYLGPDENITTELIEWFVARAAQRGYPLPTALMSSKPGAGINHKQYGVTSEGVAVFLRVALRSVGVDPAEQPFTIKMTGGPDGDVGGNLIRILHRDYGDRARIIGIADGSGSGEDPRGLDHEELLRLFGLGLPIADFERAKLSPEGRIVALDEPEGVQLRNTLHNRLVADAFVPCGGRPNAIHAGNWRDYLTADGRPSSRIIVEGANLFLTPEARNELSGHGVFIVKDSSANKCGVITSSYEIIANMLLGEEEFIAIKETFVEQIVQRLRELARREAELLVRVHRRLPNVPLPETSTRISRVMMRAADAIEGVIDRLTEEDAELMRWLVREHLPPILLQTAGDRLWERTPKPYLKWIMAKSLAAGIVYCEGFEHVEEMPEEAIADLAVRYLRHKLERMRLAEAVEQSTLPERERIASMLRCSGILSMIDGE